MKNWLRDNWAFTLWSIFPLFLIIVGILDGEWITLIAGGILFTIGYFRYNYNNPLVKPWVRLIGKVVIVLWLVSLIIRGLN